mgnify:CR=1 FL=1
MIYIVGVLVITVTTTGYLYGMMASVCSVLLFNYFFTVPVHTFAMTDQNDVVRLVFSYHRIHFRKYYGTIS